MEFLDEALLRYVQLQKISKPYANHINLLKEWLDRPEGGDFFLRGYEAEIWQDDGDIIALSDAHIGQDSCTRFINGRIAPLYHHLFGLSFRVGKNACQ